MSAFPFPSLLAMNLGVDLLSAIRENDLMGWACLVVLVTLSVVSGTMMVHKLHQVRRAANQSDAFTSACMESHHSLDDIYLASKRYPDSPLAVLMQEAYIEYQMEATTPVAAALSLEHRVALGRASVESVLERTIASEMRRLEGGLVWIASTSSLAPFLGLLGTVWGVLGCFQSLAREQSASLATLAPGISTALVTTTFGLFAAIPAVAVYNYLTAKIGHLSSRMDSFAHELSNVFQKHLLKKG